MNENNSYIDVGALTVWIAAAANILPSIAALLSVIWFLIRIAESETVQRMFGTYAWINHEKVRNAKNDAAKD